LQTSATAGDTHTLPWANKMLESPQRLQELQSGSKPADSQPVT
jgi:hypothetical protein